MNLLDTYKFDCNRSREQKIRPILDFNMNYFGKMGGTHVVSAFEILNFKGIWSGFLERLTTQKAGIFLFV